MNRAITLCAVLSMAVAAVIPEESQAKIVKYESSNDGSGNYNFSYETSNGITREEFGYLVNPGQDDEHIVVQGSYSYTDVKGKLILIKYTADDKGYQINPPSPASQVFYSVPPSVVATLLGK